MNSKYLEFDEEKDILYVSDKTFANAFQIQIDNVIVVMQHMYEQGGDESGIYIEDTYRFLNANDYDLEIYQNVSEFFSVKEYRVKCDASGLYLDRVISRLQLTKKSGFSDTDFEQIREKILSESNSYCLKQQEEKRKIDSIKKYLIPSIQK